MSDILPDRNGGMELRLPRHFLVIVCRENIPHEVTAAGHRIACFCAVAPQIMPMAFASLSLKSFNSCRMPLLLYRVSCSLI